MISRHPVGVRDPASPPTVGPTPVVRVLSLAAALSVPAGSKLKEFRTDVRFWVNKQPDAMVLVSVTVAGTTRLFEYPAGQDLSTGFEVLETIVSSLAPASGTPFLTGAAPYFLTVMLLAQPTSKGGLASVQFDSVEVTGTVVGA